MVGVMPDPKDKSVKPQAKAPAEGSPKPAEEKADFEPIMSPEEAEALSAETGSSLILDGGFRIGFVKKQSQNQKSAIPNDGPSGLANVFCRVDLLRDERKTTSNQLYRVKSTWLHPTL